MRYAEDLLEQAESLARREPKRPKQASSRRAISTAYYGVFHLLTGETAGLLLRGTKARLRSALARAFSHSEMAAASKSFGSGTMIDILARSIGTASVPTDLRIVAAAFINLQQARHEADYDLATSVSRQDARDLIERARAAFQAWQRVKGTQEAIAYRVALLCHQRLKQR